MATELRDLSTVLTLSELALSLGVAPQAIYDLRSREVARVVSGWVGISELTDDVWTQALARHVFYVVRSVRATLPHMTTESGSILNVVSGVVERPAVGMAAPVAVWSAVIGYAKTLALEVGEYDINVNTMLSGYFDTALFGKTLERQPELSMESLGSTVPMGRIGQPAEFADFVAALVSPHQRFVTGLVAPVDGGAGIGMGASFTSARSSG